MTVGELFRNLSFGELSNLAVGDSGTGLIPDDKHPQMIGYLNDALLRLYSRFTLSEKSVVITMLEDRINYPLKKIYAQSNTDSPVALADRFILDELSGEFFDEDVIKVLEVHTEAGDKMSINDKDVSDSLFLPSPDTLQIPVPEAGQALGVLYQARHPKLRDMPLDDDDDILTQEIVIPFFLEEALKAFIGYKVYSHINGQENSVKSQEFFATFGMLCDDVDERDLANQTSSTSHDKLHDRGFV